MIEDQSVQTAKGLQSQVDGLLAEGEIREIAVQHLDLLRVLVFQFLEGFDAAGDYDDVVGLGRGEEEFGDCESDACRVDRLAFAWPQSREGFLLI